MAGKDVFTTRIGDTVKVEIKDPTNPHGTVPNYGNVRPSETGFYWHIASGQNGISDTERQAINSTARAIRKHAAQNRATQIVVAHVPRAVVTAANKVVEHYGEKSTEVFYSAGGESIVEYRTEPGAGVGTVHIIPSRQGDDWVMVTHTKQGSIEPGLPGMFVTNVMYDTTKDWWK